jgi:glycosyltransferase involved in cell wall biosynthesis
MKLAYFSSHPIQYQSPLLKRISDEPDIELTAHFLSDFSVRPYQDTGFGKVIAWDVALLEGYAHDILPGVLRSPPLSFWRPLVTGIWHRVAAADALLVNGWWHHSLVLAVVLGHHLGKRVLMRGDSNLFCEPRGTAKTVLKRKFMKWLLSHVDACLTVGTANSNYYSHYGVPSDRQVMMPFAVDNAFFEGHAREAAPAREALRAELGLAQGRPVILYASKLQARKHPLDLLAAYRKLSGDGVAEPTPYLVYIGEGEEMEALKAEVAGTGWSSIYLLGFRNQTELPAYYDLCDVFVLPSTQEPWGLVVNEVMNAGRPIVLSDGVGCAMDLVRSGENGFVYPARDIDALAAALERVTTDQELASRMGEASRAIIRHWGFEEDVQGLRAALGLPKSPAHGPGS